MFVIAYYGIKVLSSGGADEYDHADSLEGAITKARAKLKARGWSGAHAVIETEIGHYLAATVRNQNGRTITKRAKG